MHKRVLVTTVLLGSLLPACAADEEGTKVEVLDAPKAIDAAIDAPPANLAGLGQKCGANMPACPASAPECIGFQGTNSFCTARCATGATGMTNAQGQLTSTTPPPNNAACAAAFTGTTGMPVCGVILAITPEDQPLVANKAYTGIDLGCVVGCGTGGGCPPGLSCSMNACLPN